MRIWDINPGYLSSELLLTEHRELHAIVAILASRRNAAAYDRETRHWSGHGWALKQRHRLLVEELTLRHYADITPVMTRSNKGVWPGGFIEKPGDQFGLLEDEYAGQEQGRIPLPVNGHALWSQHKYSVLARDHNLYKRLGRKVAKMRRGDDISSLAQSLVNALRKPPAEGGLRNALQHMWGHVSDTERDGNHGVESWKPGKLLREIQHRAVEHEESYLMASTALSELMAWID